MLLSALKATTANKNVRRNSATDDNKNREAILIAASATFASNGKRKNK